MQELLHAVVYAAGGCLSAVNPDEGYAEGLAGVLCGHPVNELTFILPIGFAQLPLHTVAVDGMLEVSFRHADHHHHRRHDLGFALNGQEDGTDGERRQCFAAGVAEELLDEFLAVQPLFLGQRLCGWTDQRCAIKV